MWKTERDKTKANISFELGDQSMQEMLQRCCQNAAATLMFSQCTIAETTESLLSLKHQPPVTKHTGETQSPPISAEV